MVQFNGFNSLLRPKNSNTISEQIRVKTGSTRGSIPGQLKNSDPLSFFFQTLLPFQFFPSQNPKLSVQPLHLWSLHKIDLFFTNSPCRRSVDRSIKSISSSQNLSDRIASSTHDAWLRRIQCRRSSVCGKNGDFKACNEKGSRVSLSEFLNRKLHRSSVLPGLAKGKERSFLSPEGCENVSCAKGEKGKKERGEGEKDIALDVVLQQFRHPRTEKGNACSFDNNEAGSATTDETNESRKRKSSGDHVECSKKLLAVLGDDSDIKKQGKRKSLASNEKPKHLFNRYANGGGWWDCNIEGVDNEEVGCAEVWEGMGSTTLGGLDWN